MASTAVLSTLHQITEVKLGRLARQQASFEEEKASVFGAASKESRAVAKVRVLLVALKARSGGKIPLEYEHMEKFLFQAEHDTSISTSMLGEWQRQLEQEFDWQQKRYRYTSLFGRLVTEWIKNPNQTSNGNLHAAEEDSSFEAVGREEMHEQRKDWESYAFHERITDTVAIEKYLDGLFVSTLKSKKIEKSPLEKLREQISNFDNDGLQRFDERKIRISIDSLLKADLFAGDKRQALIDLKKEDAVLTEMADVLNADLSALQEWKWEPVPLRLSMRKQINGRYRVYMDEELHQAIFIQWIGTLWAVYLKKSFISFFHSGAWMQTPYQSLTADDIRRREHFLGSDKNSKMDSIRNDRRRTYLDDYFMTQLPSSKEEGNRDYGDDDDDSSDEAGDSVKSPLAIKQSLLSLLTTESLISTHIYGAFTVLQSDFKWFGPSLPHSTIFTVLKYFHVPDKWIKFFEKFLKVSLAFAQDGEDAASQVRTCGIPMSHMLADAMGESVLFVLDFAVNQRTKGSNLYRFHDDLWFWGQSDSCVEAWEAITEFSRTMGLALNREKTGTCQITSNSKTAPLPKSLPRGNVRWGFLKFSPTAGRWIIDEEEIKKHTQEFKRQLSACRSVLAYVQAYNAYMARFFTTNLSQPMVCLGREHLDLIIATMDNIQKDIFGSGNVADHLKMIITDRFGVYDIPDGFVFFPPELGGLGLKSPLITLLSKHDSSEKPTDLIQKAYEQEEEQYENAKSTYEKGGILRSRASSSKLTEDEPFMSLEEFMRFREERSTLLLNVAYKPLLEEIDPSEFNLTPEMREACRSTTGNIHFQNQGWLLELYGKEVLKQFGSLRMGEREFLPIPLFNMLKSEKVRWQG